MQISVLLLFSGKKIREVGAKYHVRISQGGNMRDAFGFPDEHAEILEGMVHSISIHIERNKGLGHF